ncbi:MAG: PKD domain-containing protein, partial [Anaerolineae bacterium]|nr:PKD domain-containing protein [Anaerolineae bacterium]
MAGKQPQFSARDRLELGILIGFVLLVVVAVIWVDAQQIDIVQSSVDASIDVYASAMPNNGWAPLTVYYSAFGSQTPQGNIARYEWDLDGNGAFETDATAANGYASYLYTKPGEYLISLRVTDQAGNSNTDST